AQHARFRVLQVPAGIAGQVTNLHRDQLASTGHGQVASLDRGRRAGGDHGAHGLCGADGMVPAHPRGTRVRRRDRGREPPADRTHQWVGAAVGVTTGVAPARTPVPTFPPTVAVLSGVNRTSWACSVQCDRVPTTRARSPRASPWLASHAFWVNVTGLQVGMVACGMVAVWET